jgi:nucleotide-binding universal stress UspA family protein
VPQDQKGFRTGRALVAWDGGASCAAAMRAAVPLLRLASDVHIFSAVDRPEEFALEAPAAYLSRHGIHASTRIVPRGKAAADELISAECQAWSADYLVMGAYGRGRLREVFGGVTKRMLGMSSIPMVLAH